ncbi:hypothetical protein BDV27DRAFT_120530 [Aspergillus caelatus]|uniref:Uncharacterized protein n=2 Tax=Aspergillus subgen. Circumdati TaxID=2720871 RepID=A0A5N7ALJ1_9EURO|nr:uncharacterized protein BDV27DRAFT_120530 [Aspergillus caelatus]KAE8369580.1 hypothetical protein BDV27DRAFT_120530 [Aspergillus caelatus]KAE8411436.1 hypothetical protein BDV36DRAFT_274649 [Aspergillus pseudocaelatus]
MNAEDSTREGQSANQMMCWTPLSKTKSICAVEPKGFTLGKKVTFAPWVPVAVFCFLAGWTHGFTAHLLDGREARELWPTLTELTRPWLAPFLSKRSFLSQYIDKVSVV